MILLYLKALHSSEYPEKVKGKKVAITVSGGNITSEQLSQSLEIYGS